MHCGPRLLGTRSAQCFRRQKQYTNDWTLPQIAGYMRSMSATARFIKANGTDPVMTVEEELAAIWRDGAPRRIVWPVIVLAGRVGS